jgi:hypothetical protein
MSWTWRQKETKRYQDLNRTSTRRNHRLQACTIVILVERQAFSAIGFNLIVGHASPVGKLAMGVPNLWNGRRIPMLRWKAMRSMRLANLGVDNRSSSSPAVLRERDNRGHRKPGSTAASAISFAWTRQRNRHRNREHLHPRQLTTHHGRLESGRPRQHLCLLDPRNHHSIIPCRQAPSSSNQARHTGTKPIHRTFVIRLQYLHWQNFDRQADA